VCVCIFFFCMLLNYKKIKKTKKLNVFICIEFGSYFKKNINIYIYICFDIRDYNLIRKMYS